MDDSNDETSSYSDGFASISCNSEDKKEVTKHSKYRLPSTSQTIKNLEDISSLISRATATNVIKKVGGSQQIKRVPPKNITSTEPFCHVKLDSIVQLKESTKKLLCLLEDIQLKSKVRQSPSAAKTWKRRESVTPIPTEIDINSMSEVCSSALKRLETQTQLLENITTADEDDDCSVFKKLTRKCNCLTQHEYNDFVIQFNEETKYFTNTSGEIIKNLRILKKFLYMGGDYTKHALMFLNEGLNDCSYAEKVEIMQGCAFTDMCNVFEDVSLVISGIAWPYKYDSYGDSVTQELVASFLFKLSQLEEGRRYLKYTSKISNDIKKVFRLKGSKLAFSTVESLHSTLDALDPQNCKDNVTVAYHCRPGDEGFGIQTMSALQYYRRYMTMAEIFTHLDFLQKLSSEPNGRQELTKWLGVIVALFKEMLLEYNDSELNIIVTNILNNLLTRDMIVQEKSDMPKVMMVADTATEPIHMKTEANQMPIPKKPNKKQHSSNRLKSCLRVAAKRNAFASNLNYHHETAKYEGKSQVIVVPREK